jgi:CheY-like chemotaxis protein
VTQSGGHVTLESEPGCGTKIYLYLPRVEARGAASDAEVAGAAAVPVGAETILVVEDNPGMRDIALRQLHSLGYHTLAASDGAEALEIVGGDAPIDLLFTDIMMPGGMDGKALADAAHRMRPALKILFTSGFTEAAASSTMASELGIDLLSKPYRKDELARRVRAALAAARVAGFAGQE